jgi:hypothetical protein
VITNIDQFNRKFKLIDLKNPPKVTSPLESVYKDPIFHHYVYGEALGPKTLDLNINAMLTDDDSGTIYVQLFNEFPVMPDNRKVVSVNPKTLVTKYHKANRRLSRVLNLARIINKLDPLIVSYCPINQMSKRILDKSIYPYDEFKDILQIIGDNVGALVTQRLQFITIILPQLILPETDLLKLVEKPTDSLKRSLRTYEDVALVEAITTIATGNGALAGVFRASNAVITFQDGLNLIHLSVSQLKEHLEDATPKRVVSYLYDVIGDLTSLRSSETVNVEDTYSKTIEAIVTEKSEVKVRQKNTPDTLTERALKPLLSRGSITEAQYTKHLELSTTYKTIPNPIGKGTLEDVVKINQTRDVKFLPKPLPKMDGVDNRKLSNAKAQLDKEYINKHMELDLINTMMSVQQGPFAVVGLTKEEHRDAGTHSVVYKTQTKALNGGIGTLVMEFPVVKEDGTFDYGGVAYRMAAQRVTFPVVKIEPNVIAMTSAVSKLFLTAGKRKAQSYPEWLLKNISAAGSDGDITKLKLARHRLPIDNELLIPSTYAIIGNKYQTFTLAAIDFDFNRENVDNIKDGVIQCGTIKGAPVYLRGDNNLVTVDGKTETLLGTIDSLLGLGNKAPKMYAEIKIKGKEFPVIAILAYWLGFNNVLNYLGLKHRIVKPTERLEDNEYGIKFSDAKVAVEVNTAKDKLLAYGWEYFRNELVDLKAGDLNLTPNFSAIFTPKGITRSHEIELDIMRQYWIDPNTANLLESRDFPDVIIPLFVRCVEMLTNRQHNEETDGDIMLERSYSRFSDIAYAEYVKGIREFSRNPNSNRKLTINPHAVKLAILMDETVSPVERTSPLSVMGEQERIVYSGTMGRSNQSMVGRHRVYHKNDKGRISEGFTDDGKAGTVLYYSADPQIENFYGVAKKNPVLSPENLVSFTYLNNPFVTFDDAKRGNFSRIQNLAMRACVGANIPPVMTNVGLSAPHRAGRLYAFVTTLDGKVTGVTDEAIDVTYSDGSTDSFGLGLRFGGASGKTYPREMITDRVAGYKFGAGEVLAWDAYHFYRDRYNITQCNMYNGVWDIVVFRERAGTYEDASRMSKLSAKKTASDIVHIKPIFVTFDDNIKLNVKLGDVVEQDDVLGYITPVGIEVSTAQTSNSLDYFSAASPKASYDGKVVRIEVFYMGDVKEASVELQKLIAISDKDRKVRSKSEDIFPTGEYKSSTYIQKQELVKNSAVILVYLMHREDTVTGDKVANANSLKTVPGKIYESEYTLEDGTPVDSDASYKGLKARITPGAELLGLLGMFSRQVGLNAAKAYRNE